MSVSKSEQPTGRGARRWDAERPGLTWQRFMDNKNKELQRLNGVYMKLLEGSKVDYHEGRGRIVDAHTVEVDGRRFTARPARRRCRHKGAKLSVLACVMRHASLDDTQECTHCCA